MLFLIRNCLFICLLLFFSACSVVSTFIPSTKDTPNTSAASQKATMRPYTINGKTYYPKQANIGDKSNGTASWYGPKFHGKKTSNGETYNMYAMTAAHKTLPMNTMVKVTNLNNGFWTTVRINDRGPFVDNRIIDLSKNAASKIGMLKSGTVPVSLEVVGFYNKTFTSSTKTMQNSTNSNFNLQNSSANNNFMLQIGAFSNETGAKNFQNKYNNLGGYKAIIKTSQANNSKIYKVLLSGFKSQEEAKNFMHSQKMSDAIIIRE